MGKKFKLNGAKVEVKNLTLGDLKKMQKLLKDEDEEEYPSLMISYCTGISREDFDNLPIECVTEVEIISNYIGGLIDPKQS